MSRFIIRSDDGSRHHRTLAGVGKGATFGRGLVRLQAAGFIPCVLDGSGALRETRIQQDYSPFSDTMAEMERDIVRLSTKVCGAAKGKALREWYWRGTFGRGGFGAFGAERADKL